MEEEGNGAIVVAASALRLVRMQGQACSLPCDLPDAVQNARGPPSAPAPRPRASL